jgi:putative chitinase
MTTRADQLAAIRTHLAAVHDIAESLALAPPVAAAPPPPPPAAPALTPQESAAFAFTDYGKFYDWLRGNDMLGPTISTSEYSGCDAILKACALAQSPLAFTADTLATAYLETAHTMQPVKEYGGTAYYRRMYDIEGQRPNKARELGNLTPGDGAKYAGRGYPQMTGKTNYARADKRLHELGILKPGENLVDNPDLAMRPDVAAAIMIYGMHEGWFTGKKLADYLPAQGPANHAAFKQARRIINGQDRADDIARYALNFQTALQAGGWRF